MSAPWSKPSSIGFTAFTSLETAGREPGKVNWPARGERRLSPPYASRRINGIALEAMRWPLEAFGYEIIEEIAVFGLFDRGIIRKEKAILAQARQAGEKLAKAVMP